MQNPYFPLLLFLNVLSQIHIANMFLSLAGGAVVALSSIAYYHLLKDKDEDSF